MKTISKMLCGISLTVSLSAIAAESVEINDLAPYDNNVSSGDFWNTTGHAKVSVNRDTMALNVAIDARKCVATAVNANSVASSYLTWADADDFIRINTTAPSGIVIIVR